MNIILIGPPGSGKGTQAQLIAKKYGYTHISSGQLIRHGIENKNPTALKIKTYLDKGELAPDKYVIKLVKDNLDKKGNIFDGFPRDINQAEALDELTPIHLIIELDISDKEILKRLLIRAREDDTEDIIKHRINIYKDITQPLIEYYKPREIVHHVNASKSVEKIFENICSIIETHLQ